MPFACWAVCPKDESLFTAGQFVLKDERLFSAWQFVQKMNTYFNGAEV